MADIFCFQHCKQKVFGLNSVPDVCAACDTPLSQCDAMRLPPFKVPTPFVDLNRSPRPLRLVIRPTRGDFLHDYNGSAYLHVGLTDSACRVFEYDADGLHAASRTKAWTQCLSVDLGLLDRDVHFVEFWDDLLHASRPDVWSPEAYHPSDYNCLTYVLSVVSRLRHHPHADCSRLVNVARNKVDFCEKYVLAKTKIAAKYISLYRKLRASPNLLYVRRDQPTYS